MTPRDIAQLLKQFATPSRRRSLAAISKKGGNIFGAAGSAATMALGALPQRNAPVLVVADDADSAAYIYNDLQRLDPEAQTVFFPSAFRQGIKYGQADGALRIMRTEALAAVANTPNGPRYIITYPEALAQRVAPAVAIAENTLTFSNGQTVSLSNTVKQLLDHGFEQTDYVYLPGQFARRGSILDIFGFNSDLPVRIDFFGDDIETIRTFDIETQLSLETLQTVAVTANVDTQSGTGTSLPQILPPDTLVAIFSNINLQEQIAAIIAQTPAKQAIEAAKAEGGEMPIADLSALSVDPHAMATALAAMPTLTISRAPIAENQPHQPRTLALDCSPQGIYHKNFDLIARSFKKLQDDGYTLFLLSDNPKQHTRLHEIFKERGDDISFQPITATLHQGFVDHVTKTCVFTDHQIFDRFHKYNLHARRTNSGRVALSLKELGQIHPGDYIVHTDHGIGRFAGLITTDTNGSRQEMIKLLFQNDDMVLVSIHALHKLSKYRGKDGEPPKISRLGTGAWNKIKERTKKHLKDIARDLILLYAARKNQPGFAFAPDSYLQQQLEASFIYEDTPDQLTATQQVKADMESTRPMDRLICGDVGFGKTEIAIRAAFKAAVDGKQTAVLVPTTVLAYQHFNTFSQRLKDFPVRVEYLSRARTAAQTKQILTDLKDGKIDIIIGTHKLIGKGVDFNDLGLLVIDEEQKFGVAVKDKLKQLKTSVDTLTLSATPIPRTLQFSLMGARDLSAITTPPPNRHPITTQVAPLSDDLLREALEFELARGGQAFIVNNRIEGLYNLHERIQRLLPKANITVAHGQMPPAELEKAITDFAQGNSDILLSTTIIESGIDMPSVNTIIVNNAQNFGLSELHQLRGRVGRSARKAFCYLTIPEGKELTPVARRRLQAIEAFSDLGSGIHIAMQDLDIRGAGNLLGAEQSGFIADLGYETYQKILEEAVTELRTQEFPGLLKADAKNEEASDAPFSTPEPQYVAETTVETDLSLLLPASYVPGQGERISLYRELDTLKTDDQLAKYARRLADRFGPVPPQTRQLMLVPALRREAQRLGIEKVVLRQGKMHLYFPGEENTAYYQSPAFGRLITFLQQNPHRVQLHQRSAATNKTATTQATTTTRRSFIVAEIPTVQAALETLKTVSQLPSV